MGHTEGWSPDLCYDRMKPENTMLREGSQSPQTTYYRNPFVWNIRNKQMCGNNEWLPEAEICKLVG